MESIFIIVGSLAPFFLFHRGYILGLRMPLRPHLVSYIFKFYRRRLINALIIWTALIVLFTVVAVFQFVFGQFISINVLLGIYWVYGFTLGFGLGFDGHYKFQM